MKINIANIRKNEETRYYIEKYNLKVIEIMKLFDFQHMITYVDENERFKFSQEDLYITKDYGVTKKYSEEHHEELMAFLIIKDNDYIELDLSTIA